MLFYLSGFLVILPLQAVVELFGVACWNKFL
jgi:hypothetical protein